MKRYIEKHSPMNHSSKNLLTLRYDLCMAQFDLGNFVIVPKSKELVVHFVRHSVESAQLYHNGKFDHDMTLSHELLYARFTWTIIKMV
ncbi:hypothetical protein M413DRAFT_246942 [Hebeloma cylindrosporum]|uniref:HNH nuclease domain-containing protein n=1 Tax=Hebeloma cylindrosporum TaxID=76867 RepID=A0A0C2YAX2_HEBCY|nr:hypothetical protein M413DRAFT_246942 [Hebeloma cylindrosporum h7]